MNRDLTLQQLSILLDQKLEPIRKEVKEQRKSFREEMGALRQHMVLLRELRKRDLAAEEFDQDYEFVNLQKRLERIEKYLGISPLQVSI